MVTLAPFASYAGSPQSQTVLIALLVALIPTTIGALLSAIGIAGMDRLVQRNVLAMSGRAVEASGDVDVLLLDKTGTITLGNRQASEFIPVDGVTDQELAEAAQLSSLSDETPEGRSIVVLAKERYGLRERQLSGIEHEFVPFSATTRMSGVDMNGNRLRKGAADAVKAFVTEQGGRIPERLDAEVDRIARAGGTPLVVAQDNFVLGVIHLKDIVKGGMRERFDELRRMGIRTVMITGDNRVTAAVIAEEAGVDDFLAEATPEAKMTLIREEQGKGRMVAMTGDGTNDAPALAQADVGVAMNTGTSAAKEAGNMVDLDSNPTKLIEIVEVGKQLLITRGSLTTFSIANDVAKYFAILPAMFAFTYGVAPGERGPLRRAQRDESGHAEERRSLSAIIFNALIIPALMPLALRGVRYRAIGATALLRRNLLIYGLGGVILPFVGIKADRPGRAQPARRMTVRAWLDVASGDARALPASSSAPPPASARPTGCSRRDGRRRRGRRRRDRLPRAARPAGDVGACRGAGDGAAPAQSSHERHRAQRDGRGRGHPPRARAGPDRRAGAHQRARLDATSSATGHRRRAGRRHRRHLHGQRPAPGEPERPGLRADRSARPGDVPRPDPRRGGRGRAGRPGAGGAARAAAAPARCTRPAGSTPRSRTSSARRTWPSLRQLALRELAEDVEARREARGGDQPAGRSRRSSSGSWCWSSRGRGRSACCAGPGGPASGWAPTSTRCGCAGPGERLTEDDRSRWPRCAAWRRCWACTSWRRRATT